MSVVHSCFAAKVRHRALVLIDWLSIHPHGVGVDWATRQSDRKPCLDNSLNDLFGFWRRCRFGCLAVVPDDALPLRQFLQRFTKRLHLGGRSVDRNAPSSHYGSFQNRLRWLPLSRRANRGGQKQENTENRA
jgi:hypothetical protein